MRKSAALTLSVLMVFLSNALIGSAQPREENEPSTTTPIKHLVVIFDENISFDHYFGTYPVALNPPEEPPFVARPDTPTVNGLNDFLKNQNPNGTNPMRLDPLTQSVTCDNDNHYKDEQKAYDGGLLDKFSLLSCAPGVSMNYYDGNSVTALWNYAQHFTISDNFFATEFGTTSMGHLNLVSGKTYGATPATGPGVISGVVIANVDPAQALDDCSPAPTSSQSDVQMSGQNVGDLLNGKDVTWGWFYGDWMSTAIGTAVCNSRYNPHYAPFQFYASTADPHHRPRTSVAMIGHSDQANHQYSLDDFTSALASGDLPAVTFLKAPSTNTGHPANSSPLAEQQFLVNTINLLQQSPHWKDMAILITYDDSDGWYDHVMPPIVSQSHDAANDALLGTNLCGTPPAGAYEDRCGYGPRLPFVVISPFAKENYVDHTLLDQTSVLRFIEDNWQLGRIDSPPATPASQSFDAIAGSIVNCFDFDDWHGRDWDRDHGRDRDRGRGRDDDRHLILDPNTGEPLDRDWR